MSRSGTAIGSLPCCALSLFLLAGSALAAPEGVRHVRAEAAPGGDGLSWATAYNDLRVALDVAGASGGAITELWVKAGTYNPKPSTSTDRTFAFRLAENIGLYGGFAGTETERDQRDPVTNDTILDAAFNSYNVVVCTGSGVVDGFTITRGVASRSPATSTGWAGGGIHITGSPAIRNCLITNNSTGAGLQEDVFRMGGGVYCAPGSAATFSDCTFDANRTGYSKYSRGINAGAGAGLAADQCTVTLTRCAFTGNLTGDGGYTICAGGSPLGGCDGGDGAGLALLSASAVIRDCSFIDNRTGTATKSDICTFGGSDGRAAGDGGGIYTLQSTALIVNALFAGNRTGNGGPGGDRPGATSGTSGGRGGNGGAIFSVGGDVEIVNATMSGNMLGTGGAGGMSQGGPGPSGVPGAGSGVYGDSSTHLENCISWHTGVGELIAATAAYSDIRGGYAGVGNINIDPLFMGSGSGDYRLQETSPCIDAGNSFPSATALPADDLAGLTRRVDVPTIADTGVGSPVVDMGAYEVQFCAVDLNGDGYVDFADYLEFLNLFDAGDLRVDFTGDGLVDFSDYLEFLNLFDAGC